MKMYVVTIQLLLLSCWTIAAKNVFDKTNMCDEKIVKKIDDYVRDHPLPDDIEDQLKKRIPWGIYYSNYKHFPTDTVQVNFYEKKVDIISKKTLSKEKSTISVDVKWNELFSILSSSHNLRMHIWTFQEGTNIFGFYLCKARGGDSGGEHHFGVAVSVGDPGGIPNEATTNGDVMKDDEAALFSINKNDFKEYDLTN